MSTPVKPWERPGINYQNNASLPGNTMSASPVGADHIQAAISRTANPVSSAAPAPPQLPPRPSQQSQLGSRIGTGLGYGGYGGYGGLSSFGSPMGYGGYGGLYNSPYSSYGGYGYNRMGPADVNSAFARQAEESSRPAFESIESIVHAVNSVGMMLDSTFQAVYSSFRAVIGVADNFTRLKSQLVQVLSALAFIRTLKYMFRKLLELIRLRPKGEADKLWRKAFEEAAAASAASPGGGPKKSAWPILMFFGIIMGGPYLIWKVISAFSGSTDEKGWARGEDDHFVARANFSFQGQGTDELTFSAGQNINIAPKELQPRVRGWLLASVDGEKVGMIPANYVQVLGKRRGSRNIGSSQTAPLEQSESSINLSQESQFPSSTPVRNMATVPENELESAFGGDINSLTSQTTENIASSLQDSSNQEAADILDDAEK